MHRLSFFSLLFICIAVLADGKAPDGFVLIPKNPAFSFANAIQERVPGRHSEQKAGEKSSIASDY